MNLPTQKNVLDILDIRTLLKEEQYVLQTPLAHKLPIISGLLQRASRTWLESPLSRKLSRDSVSQLEFPLLQWPDL